jgi:hypothetical protein
MLMLSTEGGGGHTNLHPKILLQHHFNFPTIYRELNYITTNVDKKFYVLQAMNYVLN